MGLGYGGKQKGVELELWAGVIREAQTDEFEEAVASHHTRDQYPSALIIVSSIIPLPCPKLGAQNHAAER